MVIWIIGLSGSGKTFLANKIFSKISGKKILVDGDDVRRYITYKLNYSKKDRELNSILISDLCKFLEVQGFVVVCSILSIFRKHQKLNKKKYKNYIQIYLKSDLSTLKRRNSKEIYSEKKNVVGKKINFPEPYKSDLVIKNDFKSYKKSIMEKILEKINDTKKNKKFN
jgi:adenylylsulfate kinase